MDSEQITFINTTLVPLGLMAIMFSMGMSLTLADFRRLFEAPLCVLVGLLGQLLLLPILGFSCAFVFRLPPDMALGLCILAFCPGGVTSNAVIFAARGNVALSITLTGIASLVTVFSTPLLIALALEYYFGSGEAPDFSITKTIVRLFQMTVIPISLGMIVRVFSTTIADRLVVWLRPASMVVLISVIAFSLYVSFDLVLENIVRAGPAALVLNMAAMFLGFCLARAAHLSATDTLTVSIEVGVQNATMATFLALSVLNDLSLAITPTLYGAIMIFSAVVLVRLLKKRFVVTDEDSTDYSNKQVSS